MSLKDLPPNLRPYVFHGIHLDYKHGDKGGLGVCPFCDDHSFFVWARTHGYVCKNCGESGNHYTFLKTLYARSVEFFNSCDHTPYHDLDDSEYIRKDKFAQFMLERALTYSQIKAWGIVPSYITMEPLVPGYNEQDVLSNLYRVFRTEGKLRPHSTPQCKLHPYRLLRSPDTKDAWAVEGLWDAITATTVAAHCNLPVRVIGIPGVNSFKPEWLDHYFPGDVYFIFDNDHPRRKFRRTTQPAWDGLQSIFEMARQAKAIHRVRYARWGHRTYHDPARPSGFDLTDLYHECGASALPRRIYDMATRPKPKSNPAKNAAAARNGSNGSANGKNGTANKSTKLETPYVKPIPCHSFSSLCKHYESCIHFSQNLRDTLTVMLAAVVSTPLDGDQLWFRIMGPPGSGKTTLAECISAAREYVYPLSLNTGFHSGYKENPKDEEDHSLLKDMHNKTTIVKDADTLLKNSSLERILAEMRDFYDGVSRATYRNIA
jgi:hypothetical protein